MRFFVFWIPFLLAGGLLSLEAVGRGIPARTLDARWTANLVATCSQNSDKCISLSFYDAAIGIWHGRVVMVKARNGQDGAAVAMITNQLTEFQKRFVAVGADTKGVKK